MTRFDNNAEGGTNGATVTTADVASGTPWTNVVGGPTWTTTSAIDGAVSITFAPGAQRFVGWDDTTSSSCAITIKLTIPAAPSGSPHRLIDIRSSGGSIGNLIVPNGVTTLTANAGTGATTAQTVSLTPGAVYWATLVWTGLGTAASAVTLKLYDATGALLDTKTATGGTTALPMLRGRYGNPTVGETGLGTAPVLDRFSQDIGSGTEIPPPPLNVTSTAPLDTVDATTASGSVGVTASAPMSTTDAVVAAGVVGTVGAAALQTTDGLSAAGVVGKVSPAPLVTTDGLTGSGAVGQVGSAPLSTTDSFTAAGTVAAAGANAPMSTTDGFSAVGTVGKLGSAPFATSDSFTGAGTVGGIGVAGLGTSDLFTASGSVSTSGIPTAKTGFVVSGSARTEPYAGPGTNHRPYVGSNALLIPDSPDSSLLPALIPFTIGS